MLGTLSKVVAGHGQLTVAVSGGVDSMTLAHVAHRVLGAANAHMVHAVSPAVPGDATARVERHAAAAGWRYRRIDAGEFADPHYRENPVNRCYFCKSNLYGTIASLVEGTIASGTNVDDLGDFRPGLTAAKERNVVHPFVEAGATKADVRAIAAELGLDDLAELPAQPCLSSRVETGIAIDARDLALVDSIERTVRALSGGTDVRCRIRRDGVHVEIDAPTLAALPSDRAAEIEAQVAAACARSAHAWRGIGAYARGSAFLRDRASS